MERDDFQLLFSHVLQDFNSHAHVERDVTKVIDVLICCIDFNSHAHVERDQKFTNTFVRRKHFNSHAHVERDQLFQK